jgi:hypothetical protein
VCAAEKECLVSKWMQVCEILGKLTIKIVIVTYSRECYSAYHFIANTSLQRFAPKPQLECITSNITSACCDPCPTQGCTVVRVVLVHLAHTFSTTSGASCSCVRLVHLAILHADWAILDSAITHQLLIPLYSQMKQTSHLLLHRP